jgi:hypothetical protein
LLFNAGILPHSNKHGYEPGIFCRFERLLHAPPRPGIGGSKFDPEKDYPKTGYSAQSTLTLVLQTEGRRLLRSFLLMMLVGSGALCGCAPAGHFYETGSFVARPRDACALPETAVGFATSLNKKIGQRDGPRERVASVQGLVASGILIESRDQFVSCRGALVFASGQTQSGTLSVVDRTTGEITQSSWQSDEALKGTSSGRSTQKRNGAHAVREL